MKTEDEAQEVCFEVIEKVRAYVNHPNIELKHKATGSGLITIEALEIFLAITMTLYGDEKKDELIQGIVERATARAKDLKATAQDMAAGLAEKIIMENLSKTKH